MNITFEQVDIQSPSEIAQATARLIVAELLRPDPADYAQKLRDYIGRQSFVGAQHYALTNASGQLLAAAEIKIQEDQSAVCEVRGLAVSPSQRGKGYGRHMLGRVAQEAHQSGADSMQLYTQIPAFFEQYGFSGEPEEMVADTRGVIAQTLTAKN